MQKVCMSTLNYTHFNSIKTVQSIIIVSFSSSRQVKPWITVTPSDAISQECTSSRRASSSSRGRIRGMSTPGGRASNEIIRVVHAVTRVPAVIPCGCSKLKYTTYTPPQDIVITTPSIYYKDYSIHIDSLLLSHQF